MFNTTELKKAHLENRLAKLSMNPVQNKNLIAKVQRKLKSFY